MPINFPNSPSENDTYSSGGTTWIFDSQVWNVVTSSTVINITPTNSFETIAVQGQPDIVAEDTDEVLTLIAGTNITLVNNAENKSVTIAASAGEGVQASNSFVNIAVAGQTTVVADSTTDTLTLVAGTGMQITTNAATDSITFTSTASGGGAENFVELTDAIAASLTVDKIYLPAITMLSVNNVGATAYTFDQYSGNNPTIFALAGATLAFNLDIGGHPFLIQDPAGNNYNTGLIHVTTSGVVTTGSNAQGKTSGTLYWKLPESISGNYRYQCSIHAGMVGAITVKRLSII